MYFKVTDKQKSIIEYKLKYENATPEEIRLYAALLKPNNQLHRLSTIKKWIERFRQTGSMDQLPKTGRPKKLSNIEENKVIDFVLNNPKIRYPSVKRALNLNVHPRTINRIVNKRGIRTFRIIKRPTIKRKNRLQRYSFCKQILRSNIIDKIIFTDEKKFQNSSDKKVEYVNRMIGTAYEDKHVRNCTTGSSSADINIWGYIGSFGKGRKYFCLYLLCIFMFIFFSFAKYFR